MAGRKPKRLSPPLAGLKSFEAAARHLSFASASKELHVTSAAVSQHVRSLEHIFRRKLFHRVPRGLLLTEHGEAYLPIVQDALSQLDAGTQKIFGTPDRQEIVIKAPSSLSVGWLGRLLPELNAAFPHCRVVLTTFHWNQEETNLSVDLEIRHGQGDWPDVSTERLIEEEIFPVCSPDLLRNLGSPLKPEMLLSGQLFHNISPIDGWTDWFRTAGVDPEIPEAKLAVDSTLIALQLAKAGHGFALGRTMLVEDDLRAGHLVAPFETRHQTREAFYIVHPKNHRTHRDVVALTKWLKEATGQHARI